MKVEEFIVLLKKNLEAFILARQQEHVKIEDRSKPQNLQTLPSWFGYPAARHSSFTELQEFVKSLSPRDVYPCVAAEGSWYQKDSIRKLFGKHCTGTQFAFDLERDLDREHVRQDKETEAYMELEERRAAGMENSQQASSQQFLPHSSQEEVFTHGRTQSDDTAIKNMVPNIMPQSTCLPGDTQIDRFDPYDPSILAKVEKAVEEGRILSKSILGSNSYGKVVESQASSVRNRGSTQDDEEDIALCFSSNGTYQSFTARKQKNNNKQAQPALKQEKFAARTLRHSQMSTTASTVSSHARQDKNLDIADKMDCSQDSLDGSSVMGDLDREEVRDVMKAVKEGRWAEKSKELGFNSMRWKYQKEEEF
ncbi:hypothetical protein ABW20_dc0109263 [Dactylellina cionopaga]|nr:hypothetical protein ABW20_dc0109263 [Dactylellina cionopaga]